MTWQVVHGDSLKVLRTIPADSVDALVTDPPAGIEFMGKSWDKPDGIADTRQPGDDEFHGSNSGPHNRSTVRYGTSAGYKNANLRQTFVDSILPIFVEVFRVMKPGAHGLVWALPRTQHWTATALENAGFEIRDVVTHLFGSGFPKSLSVPKAIDALLGAPSSDEAKRWTGYGTALKPAAEMWILVRKPLSKSSVARNVLEHSTGAINIDGCRIEGVPPGDRPFHEVADPRAIRSYDSGRYPSNVVFSHHPLCEPTGRYREIPGRAPTDGVGKREGGFMDVGAPRGDGKPNGRLYGDSAEEVWDCIPGCAIAQVDAQTCARPGNGGGLVRRGADGFGGKLRETGTIGRLYGDSGGASRFFYVAKPSATEKQHALRELSLFDDPTAQKPERNSHPTVKPVALMRYLCRLVTPGGGVILDPFAGSGTTGVAAIAEGFDVIMVEREAESVATARARAQQAAAERGFA